MLAYAVRFEVNEIILFYPNTIKQVQEEETELIIKDALADGKEISIKAFQLPIINRELLENNIETKTNLSELFKSTREGLISKVEKILK
jgi:5-methylcytosine-specific restriction enzyme subunit McrC